MSNKFIVSDTHWGHAKLLTFTNAKGELERPGFKDVDEMNEIMVQNWNSVVSPWDLVYHLGDVAMGERGLKFLDRCNGRKILIRGNHDKASLDVYGMYFEDVLATCSVNSRAGFIMSHIPLHPSSLYRWTGNVHGHLHSNRVLLDNGHIDKRYWCAAVEHTNYTPIAYEEVKKITGF